MHPGSLFRTLGTEAVPSGGVEEAASEVSVTKKWLRYMMARNRMVSLSGFVFSAVIGEVIEFEVFRV